MSAAGGGAGRVLSISLVSSYKSGKQSSITVNGVSLVSTATYSRVLGARIHPLSGESLGTIVISNPGRYSSGATQMKKWLKDTVQEGDIVLITTSGCFYRTTSVIATWVDDMKMVDPDFAAPTAYCSTWMVAGLKQTSSDAGSGGGAPPSWFGKVLESRSYGSTSTMSDIVIPLGFALNSIHVNGCASTQPTISKPNAFTYVGQTD